MLVYASLRFLDNLNCYNVYASKRSDRRSLSAKDESVKCPLRFRQCYMRDRRGVLRKVYCIMLIIATSYSRLEESHNYMYFVYAGRCKVS